MQRFFRGGQHHFPYYSPPKVSITATISPYGFFFGICAPFIQRTHTFPARPAAIYIDLPLYTGDVCRGYAPLDPMDNFLDRRYLLQREPGLAVAVDNLRDAFLRGDIDALVTLVDPNVRIAVFLRGKYEYSLDPNDYLDMTRDAMLSTETISFDVTQIHERAAGVYVVSGAQVYRDPNGQARRVYFSYVLQEIRGVWTLTQVGTAPDRVQGW